MLKERRFSEKLLREIEWWAWAAAILPITALAAIFFIWAFGTKTMFDIAVVAGATFMFSTAAVWWWWIIWTVSRIMRKDRKVAHDFIEAQKSLQDIKDLVKETFTSTDK
jgi:hypothetical protein